MRGTCIKLMALAGILLGSTLSAELMATGGERWNGSPALENGDVNGDEARDVSDAVYLLAYMYTGGPAPSPLACGGEISIWENGDVNGDWGRDISDAVSLLGFLYSGGAAPVAPCDFARALGHEDGAGAAGNGNPNPGILPPHARPHGKSYGEWNRAWWEWNIAIPRDRNPVSDTTGAFCAEGQSGPVWFLAGSFGGNVVRSCTVPPGKTLFFPVLNTVTWVPRRGNTEEEIRAFAYLRMNSATLLEATIDGVPAKDIAGYLAGSEAFTLVLPANDVIGLGPASFYPAVGVGYSLMVTPLTPGEHTIHIAAASTFPGPFSLDITYYLTVAQP